MKKDSTQNMTHPIPSGKFHGSPKESHKFNMPGMMPYGGQRVNAADPGLSTKGAKAKNPVFGGGGKTSSKVKGMKVSKTGA